MRMNGSQVVVEECAEFSLSEYGASSNRQMRQIVSTFLCLVTKRFLSDPDIFFVLEDGENSAFKLVMRLDSNVNEDKVTLKHFTLCYASNTTLKRGMCY